MYFVNSSAKKEKNLKKVVREEKVKEMMLLRKSWSLNSQRTLSI